MQRTHGVEHWDPDNCFGCKIRTTQITPSAMPSRHPTVVGVAEREKTLQQDLADYKAMRLQGLHPKSTEGAHRIAQEAKVSYEVDSGQLASTKAKGYDAAHGGKEWARRAQDAYEAVNRGEVLEMTS